MTIANSFSNIRENILTKKFGGHQKGVADPYITGYHFVWFENIPNLAPYLEKQPCGNIENIPLVLAGLCTGVTPPGGTLNKVEFTGLGGVKWSVPGNIDYGNTVSVKFTEMSGLPIKSIMHSWVKLIRDYRTGVSNIDEPTYSKQSYSSIMYYWTTAPDAKTVEYYACYDGLFPSKDPQDLFASDVETVGKLDIEIEFNVDYAWHEDWVLRNCSKFAEQFTKAKSVVENYKY